MPTGIERHHTPTEHPAEEDALEEIRELFARYRRLARHGVAAEREDVSTQSRAEPADGGKARTQTRRPPG